MYSSAFTHLGDAQDHGYYPVSNVVASMSQVHGSPSQSNFGYSGYYEGPYPEDWTTIPLRRRREDPLSFDEEAFYQRVANAQFDGRRAASTNPTMSYLHAPIYGNPNLNTKAHGSATNKYKYRTQNKKDNRKAYKKYGPFPKNNPQVTAFGEKPIACMTLSQFEERIHEEVGRVFLHDLKFPDEKQKKINRSVKSYRNAKQSNDLKEIHRVIHDIFKEVDPANFVQVATKHLRLAKYAHRADKLRAHRLLDTITKELHDFKRELGKQLGIPFSNKPTTKKKTSHNKKNHKRFPKEHRIAHCNMVETTPVRGTRVETVPEGDEEKSEDQDSFAMITFDSDDGISDASAPPFAKNPYPKCA